MNALLISIGVRGGAIVEALRYDADVSGIPDDVIFHSLNPSGGTVALR
jgi:hypothetical protein